MPLTPKGVRMKRALIRKFGTKKGTKMFYARESKLTGVRRPRKKNRRKNVKGR